MQEGDAAGGRSAGPQFLATYPAFRAVWRAKVWIAATTAVLGLAVYLFSSMLPTQYLGTVSVRIGEVRTSKMPLYPLPGQWLIELPSVAADRFKSNPFRAEILKAAGLPVDDANGRMMMSTMTAFSSPLTSVIEIRVQATSPDRVARVLDAAVDVLKKAHEEIAKPRIQQLREQLGEITGELEETKKAEREIIGSLQPKGGTESLGPAVAIIALSTGKYKLNDDRRELSERLRLTMLTQAVTPPSVQPEPVGPKRLLYASIAALVTLMLLSTAVLLLAPARPPSSN